MKQSVKPLLPSPRFVVRIGAVAVLLGAFLSFSTPVRADSSGWGSSYGNSYSDYYPPSGYGHSSRGAVISLDLDPQNLLNSSFRIATREKRAEDVERLLSQGAEVDSRSDTGETALMYSARNCSPRLARLLISNGANINSVDLDGKTALILAARESCIEIVALLLKNTSIDLDVKDQTRKTALDYAGENAMLEVGGPSQDIIGLLEAAKKKNHMLKRRHLG